MTKKFAIVRPAFTFSGDGLADLPYLLIAPIHKAMYERVSGYSLGHEVSFFDTLADAKSGFEAVVASDFAFFSRRITQNAIVELEMDQDKITNFCKIYTVKGIKKVFKKTEENNEYFEKIDVPVWKEKNIASTDVTTNALVEINRQYHAQHNLSQAIPSIK